MSPPFNNFVLNLSSSVRTMPRRRHKKLPFLSIRFRRRRLYLTKLITPAAAQLSPLLYPAKLIVAVGWSIMSSPQGKHVRQQARTLYTQKYRQGRRSSRARIHLEMPRLTPHTQRFVCDTVYTVYTVYTIIYYTWYSVYNLIICLHR